MITEIGHQPSDGAGLGARAAETERLKGSVGPDRRFHFGLPRTDNAKYLRTQLFQSALRDGVVGASCAWAGFVMANGARSGHSCSMKTIEGTRKHATEQGNAEEEVLTRDMVAKLKEFVEKGAEVCAKV